MLAPLAGVILAQVERPTCRLRTAVVIVPALRSPRMFFVPKAQTRHRSSSTSFSISSISRFALIGSLLSAFVAGSLALGAGTSLAQDAPAAVAAKGEVTPSFKKAVRAYLESYGSFESIGPNIAYGAASETLTAIANSGIEITESMQEIVLEEAIQTYANKFSSIEFLTDLWAPVYNKHFTEAEVNEMTAFFNSPVGKKSLEVLPAVNQESMLAIQEMSVSIAPGFQLAVDARFREAGVSLVTP